MTDTRPTWSYEPGEHLAVLGSHLAVVVPADRRDLAARLWVVVDGGGDVVEVADALGAGGLAALTGAVVVAWEGDRVTVLARGTDPRVVVRSGDGTALVDGTTARTWVERSFEQVRSVSVLAGDRDAEQHDGPAEVLGLATGLVRVSRVARTVTDPLGDRGVEGDGRETGVDTEPAVDPEPVTAPVARGPVEPPQPTLPPSDQPTEAHPALPGADAAPTGSPGPPGPAGGAVTPLLRVSDGREVAVDGVVVVGRSPGPRDRHAGAPPRLLRLESPQQEISGTHLEVRPGTGPDAGAAVVTDLGSTNGTVVEHADGAPEALVPGVGVALGPGAVVHVGDGVTLSLRGPAD